MLPIYSIPIQTIYYLGMVVAGAFLLVHQLWRWYFGDQLYKKFVKEVATKHLPHIQLTLKILCEHLEVPYPEAPHITFMEMSRDKDGRD